MANDAVTPLNINGLMGKEATVKTIFRYRNLYPPAIAAVGAGLPLKEIVSDVYPFSKTDEAFAYNIENKADIVKIVVKYDIP